MTSDAIEETLRQLLGSSAGSPGMVFTLRRHDEYDLLLTRISELEALVRQKDSELRSMSMYAPMYLSALDELREACRLLRRLGVDTSFVRSFRR